MSRRARRKESPRKNDSRPTMPFSVPDKNIKDRLTRDKYYRASLCRAKTKLDVDMSLPLFTMIY